MRLNMFCRSEIFNEQVQETFKNSKCIFFNKYLRVHRAPSEPVAVEMLGLLRRTNYRILCTLICHCVRLSTLCVVHFRVCHTVWCPAMFARQIFLLKREKSARLNYKTIENWKEKSCHFSSNIKTFGGRKFTFGKDSQKSFKKIIVTHAGKPELKSEKWKQRFMANVIRESIPEYFEAFLSIRGQSEREREREKERGR